MEEFTGKGNNNGGQWRLRRRRDSPSEFIVSKTFLFRPPRKRPAKGEHAVLLSF